MLLAALAGCASSGKEATPSLILIIIDTLRADHLGSMGYSRARTPVLDGLATRGTQFVRAVTPVPVTLPAVCSILTGRIPPHHGVRDNERFILSEHELTLPEKLREGGWRTGAVVGSAVLAADRGLTQGFEFYDDHFSGPYPVYQATRRIFAQSFAEDRRRADTVTNKAIELLERFRGEPYFLMVHYFDVHSYYDPPPRYAQMHPGRPYDGEISFVDEEIGRLLEHAERQSDPVVVVVSDHGEGLGEHGESEHGFLLYQSTLHVPIIAAGPGIPAGLVREDPVSLIDVEPTLSAWLNLSGSGPPRDGRTLRWDRTEAETVPLYAETFRTVISYNWAELRAILDGRYKLIEGAGVVELYDLWEDPEELHDRGNVDPAASLRRHLREVSGGETREQVLASLREDIDPQRREVLESLGYVGTSSPSTPKPRDYPHPRDVLPAWVERQRTKSLYHVGLTLATRGEYDRAVAVFDSVVVRGGARAEVFYNRAVAKWKSGDERGTLADLKRSSELDRSYAPAVALRAEIDDQRGRLEQARRGWQRVHELDPTNAEALRYLSNWHLGRDEIEASLPFLRTLVNEAPEDAISHYNLGLAAARSGRPGEAREHLETFLELAPDDSRGPAVREMLQNMPGS
jgi:arylsulfatase A-like enzyme/Tfp pilus assembly protein PilF